MAYQCAKQCGGFRPDMPERGCRVVDAGEHQRVSGGDVLYSDRWNASRKLGVHRVDKFVGDHRVTRVCGVNTIQGKNAAEEVRRQPLAPDDNAAGLNVLEKSVNIYQGGALGLSFRCDELVVAGDGGSDLRNLAGGKHNVAGQWSRSWVGKDSGNQRKCVWGDVVAGLDPQDGADHEKSQPHLRRHLLRRSEERNYRNIGNIGDDEPCPSRGETV